jgi:hypothetical protein
MVHKYNLVPFAEHSVNATGIDNRNMMPDEHSMQIMWAGWSLISFLAAFICIMIFAAVLVSKEARKSGFNLYLAALMVPDIFFSLNCGITCAMNHAKRMYVSVFMCKYQTFYCTFGIAGSFWLNAVVAHEVYKVLKQKPGLGVFRGPSTKGVVYKSLAVYLFTTLVSSLPNWGVLPISGFPIRGLACIATWDNLEEELFFWFVFYPLSAGIPAVCCFYIAYRCWREKLLVVNRKGVWVQSPDDAMVRSIAYKRKAREGRQLVFYFARIFLVVIAMWVPCGFPALPVPHPPVSSATGSAPTRSPPPPSAAPDPFASRASEPATPIADPRLPGPPNRSHHLLLRRRDARPLGLLVRCVVGPSTGVHVCCRQPDQAGRARGGHGAGVLPEGAGHGGQELKPRAGRCGPAQGGGTRCKGLERHLPG